MRNSTLKECASRFGLPRCYRCGACTAACPMRKIYPDFAPEYAPRTAIARLLLTSALNPATQLTDLLDDNGLWMCLACDACIEICPQEVELRDFVTHLRQLALDMGLRERFAECARCDRPYLPKVAVEALGRYLPEEESRALLTTCPKCRPRAYSQKLRTVSNLR